MSNDNNDLDFTNWQPPPAAPEPPVVANAQPQRQSVAARAEFDLALDAIIARAERTLRIFDPTLADFGMGTPAREEQLGAFLRKSRNTRLMIVVHDTAYISGRAPRLIRLLRQFSHAVAIHQTHEAIRNIDDVLVIADESHCLRRPHFGQPRGILLTDDPVETRGWLNRFNEIWDQSSPAVSATTIGL